LSSIASALAMLLSELNRGYLAQAAVGAALFVVLSPDTGCRFFDLCPEDAAGELRAVVGGPPPAAS